MPPIIATHPSITLYRVECPAHRAQTSPHKDRCPICHQWASEVTSGPEVTLDSALDSIHAQPWMRRWTHAVLNAPDFGLAYALQMVNAWRPGQ